MRLLLIATLLVLATALPGVPAQNEGPAPDGAPTYPIAELDGCASETECRSYCDAPENRARCIDYARAHDRVYTAAGRSMPLPGPDGCATEIACIAYCEETTRLEACLDFAEQKELWPAEKIAEARQVLPHLKAGTTPGGCRSEAECRAYCDEADHFETCLAFAEQAGFVSPEDARRAREFGGAGPGGCRSEQECQAYCQSHADECVDWAVQHGMIPPEHADAARRMMANGIQGGPGGCRSEAECRAYCGEAAHFEECYQFICVDMRLLPVDACAQIREAGSFQGPGGCMSEAECQAYCTDSAHREECARFAGARGGMDDGPGTFPAECHSQGISDPGACQSYCQQDADHCGFGSQAPSGDGMSSHENSTSMGGPGGCMTPEECYQYCTTHETEPGCPRPKP